MPQKREIKNALISVFHKHGLSPIVKKLNELGVTIYSTGGTQKFIEKQGIPVNRVASKEMKKLSSMINNIKKKIILERVILLKVMLDGPDFVIKQLL